MSMISSQIDELRQMADGQATYRDARAVMLQAADTIWQLRDDLQRANADNVKLLEHSERLFDKTLELATENAKLRESCSELLRMAESNDPDFLHWPEIHDELRKLGVKIVKL